MTALDTQVGGDHYKKLPYQPVEFAHKYGASFARGSTLKYLMRWRDKGGAKDLHKVLHYIDLVRDLEKKVQTERYWGGDDAVAFEADLDHFLKVNRVPTLEACVITLLCGWHPNQGDRYLVLAKEMTLLLIKQAEAEGF